MLFKLLYINLSLKFLVERGVEPRTLRMLNVALYHTATKLQEAHFFPRFILLCLYREPQPHKTPESPTPPAQNPINWNPQPLKPDPRPHLKPQTIINEQNWEKKV